MDLEIERAGLVEGVFVENKLVHDRWDFTLFRDFHVADVSVLGGALFEEEEAPGWEEEENHLALRLLISLRLFFASGTRHVYFLRIVVVLRDVIRAPRLELLETRVLALPARRERVDL